MTDARESLTRLEELLRSQGGRLSVVLAARRRKQDADDYRRLQVAPDVSEEFLQNAVAFVRDRLVADTVRVVPYDPAYRLIESEAMVLDLGAVADGTAPLRELIEAVREVDALQVFRDESSLVDALRYYGLVMQGAGAEASALFLRVFPKTRVLRHSRMMALFFNDGVYGKLEDQVFLFDRQFDVVVWENRLFIVRLGNFHRIFSYVAELQAQAGNGVDRILDIVPVQNADEFRKAVLGQLPMAAKAAGLLNRRYLTTLTKAKLIAFVLDNDIPVKVVGEGEAAQLVFETAPERRWLILKLLDDDYLESAMTEEHYEVTSKRVHGT